MTLPLAAFVPLVPLLSFSPSGGGESRFPHGAHKGQGLRARWLRPGGNRHRRLRDSAAVPSHRWARATPGPALSAVSPGSVTLPEAAL
ncbi:hypothetical protein FHX37_1911 [Haloactinospora alba]|uniref:Uncharacterized protein n=1 Tax=Haloactinospora alba TaxID=405555 RepID=A0A543NJL1_9ACTN|nr:hypothetical protein FHX37_1911 [Haloactinospora alba]